ncbi:hypothetical protein PILCRDRAFT_387920 [Piloderma croceum F 1598]|uniref:Bromodomain-containing protein n=1 Tax=Piloderma croceum (strain F 1598) TaxID=765440 RepID=A0A0C3G1F6_PILCF|nr:hypothetical protein PILCRDRAFT_387920 [Piloderma croceum F 1598]
MFCDKSQLPGFAPPFSQIPLTFLPRSHAVTVTVTRIMNDALPNGLRPNGHPDSPTTPVNNVLSASDMKIDMDVQEQESDVRHDPRPKHASVAPELGSPLDPGPCPIQISRPDTKTLLASIAIDPPHGTPPPPPGELLEDVKMAEDSSTQHLDVQMADVGPNGRLSEKRSREPTPVAASFSTVVDSIGASTSYTTPNEYSTQEDEGSVPPPAKRARTFSDPDQASIMHSATPPPASSANSVLSNASAVTNGATPVPSTSSGASTLSIAQFRFCQSTIRNLKKLKDAVAFLRPVDPVALGIPHYPTVIKNPMDFSTIERKLTASNPNKPDPNPANPRYTNAEDFVSDVRLIFSNCITFNGPDHAVSVSGKRVEEIFDKQVKNMPAPLEKPPTPPPPPAPIPSKKVHATRRPSTSVPTIRRSETETAAVSARPKREIHPPPPKDLPYADAPKKARKTKSIKDDGTVEQLRFCVKILQEISRKAHYAIASPFYEPVDYVKLDLPTYPKIVKKPMDLSTMKKRLDGQEYSSAQKFYDDFKLMIRNCFAFNPPGTPVNQAGVELQRLFDEKWKGLPPFHEGSDDEYDEEEEDESYDERAPILGTIAMMESQIETMKGSIAALKGKPAERKPKKEKKRERPAPVASSSKVSKPSKSGGGGGGGGGNKRKGKKPIADDDVLSFEQKKDLSEAIQKLDGNKLERVIQIIHEGVPEIRDSTEEIELEIDLLPAIVLTKLYNYVLRPLRAPATKRNRTGKGTGTGGLKRKSMDEDVEAEKIRQLEERMRLFAGGGAPASAGGAVGRGDDSEHSSDSSDASDSSGSDSE